MKSISYTINDELGIHARPAGLLVKEAAKFESKITVSNGTKEADAKKIMALMMLGVKKDQTITMTFEGSDEEAAATAVENFLKENL